MSLSMALRENAAAVQNFVNVLAARFEKQDQVQTYGLSALRAYHAERDGETYEPKMKGTHVVFKTVELLQQFYGAEAVPAHKVERITLDEWPESVTIAYYAPRGRRHLQIVTLWQGRTKVIVFARQLRDDRAREQLPLEMRARLMTRKARSTEKQEHQVAYAA